MKKYLSIVVSMIVFISMMLSSCSGPMSDSIGSSGGSGGGYAPGPSDEEYAPGVDPDGEVIPDETEQSKPQILPGQLTCSALDDNKYYNFYQSLVSENSTNNSDFSKYYKNNDFKAAKRVHLKVKDNKKVKVTLLDDNDMTVYSAYSDNKGDCYLYYDELYLKGYSKDEFKVKIEYNTNDSKKTIEKIVKDNDEIIINDEVKTSNLLQIMFVVDATGSMRDEINYLQAEISDTVEQIRTSNANIEIEVAIMMYRDLKDQYVTRYSDFTSNIKDQKNFIDKQTADGGADFEEAVDVAMTEASSKQWSASAKAKVLIHVADAPSHEKDVKKWSSAVRSLANQGVQIISVASSGITKLTEYYFRTQSLMTNGTYVYLTNDSGIGNDHLDATVEEKLVVEYLNSCLVRLINGYYTGVFTEPVYYGNEGKTNR